jgi:hypothetical protein
MLSDGSAIHRRFMALYGHDAARYRLTGDESFLLRGYDRIIESLRFNNELRTSEVKFTDRISMPGISHLYAAGTGGSGHGKEYPNAAVTWEGTGRDVAVLVMASDTTSLTVRLYGFGGARTVVARPWILAGGDYEVTVSRDGAPPTAVPWTLMERGARCDIALPGEVSLEVRWRRVRADASSLVHRMDVALVPGDIRWDKGRIVTTVHNVGWTAARNIRVTFRVDGKPVGSRRISSLRAPRNVEPSSVRVSIPWSARPSGRTMTAEVSCAGPEITSDNNVASAPAIRE